MTTVNEDLLNVAISHQVYLQRYSNATVRKIIALLNRSDDRIVGEIIKRGVGEPGFTLRRLQLLVEAIRKINASAYAESTGALTDELKGLAVYEADFWKRAIQGALPIQWDIVSPSPSQLYAAVNARPFQGRLLREHYRDIEAAAFSRIRGEIRQGYIEGRTNYQIVRDIRGTSTLNYTDGILQTNRNAMERTVRTAINHTATVARDDVYRENEDVIKGWKFVATLDLRTSKECATLDSLDKVYPIGTGPKPPRHYNCRSTTAPVTKSWREMGIKLDEAPEGTRASMDGQVPESLTFDQWLRQQSAARQDAYLGPTRGRLYRQGGLEVSDFVNRKGDELTLDELRRTESEAFERAGV